ncbi:MAG: Adenylate cyclase, family 3 [Moraxellaceae bacterium]|nr:Adenylate cyclase, family 3 [Moraxellaceae bacterium]
MWGEIRDSLRSVPVWVGLAIMLAVLAVHVISLDEDGRLGRRVAQPIARLDTLIYDWRFQWLTPQRPEGQVPIVIVDVDEQSLKQEGRWPWSREKVAGLVQALERQGVRLIGFDVVFSEPEANPADALLASPALSAAVRDELVAQRSAFDSDSRLAEVVPAHTVLGYFLHADGVRTGKLPQPLLDLDEEDARGWRVLTLPDYTANLPALMERALSAGFVSTIPDRDGVIRRSPLVLMHDSDVYTSLSLELARLYLEAPYIKVQPVPCRGTQICVESIQLGDRVIRTDEHGAALVPYKGRRGSFTYVSAGKVLRGEVPRGILDGAIVLVGTSALGLADLRTIPLQTQYPGVEVHANLLDAMLQTTGGRDHFYSRPDWEPGATFVLLLVSGLLLAIVLPRLGPGAMLMVMAAWFAMLFLVNFALWKAAQYDLPLAALLLMAFLIASFNIFFGFMRANTQKREIKAMFGQYVPPAHVDQMLANPDAVSLEGETREMTVLFSDVRNFTTLSEGLSAQDLKQLLNRYFTPITQIIFDHHGTIDKYVGDMVMAFWNAPLNDPDHARHAIAAAIAMQKKVEELKAEFAADGLPEINIGVGINTGIMNVGDMGSEFRRAYTVLGDSVNLASRLESITKFYGVKVLVGEATREQVPEYLYRLVDRLIVKGKREPITVYEPVCLAEEASDSRRARIDTYNRAIGHYFAQEWEAAERLLRELLADDPQRQLYRVFLERIDELGRSPEMTAGWSGVYEHKSK